MDNALGAAGTSAAALGFDQLAKGIVLYVVLGSGATHAGVILGAITVLIIDRKLINAAAFAAAGAVLTYLGLIHGEKIAFGSSPEAPPAMAPLPPFYITAPNGRTLAALAALIELEIPSLYAAGVAENLERLLLQAKLVMDLELPPDTEPAPVFLPCLRM